MPRFALILFVFTSFVTVSSAQLSLKGKVMGDGNTPVELATVKLEGLNRIAMTNDSGYFHMHLPAGTKKGDGLAVGVSKDGYKAVLKNITVSDSLVLIILNDNSPAKAIRPVAHAVNPDTSYFQNQALIIRQADTASARELTKENLSFLFFSLSTDKSKRISIECVKDDAEALRFATLIHDVLVQSGYANVPDVSMVAFSHPVKGQFINRDASGVKITIGHKP